MGDRLPIDPYGPELSIPPIAPRKEGERAELCDAMGCGRRRVTGECELDWQASRCAHAVFLRGERPKGNQCSLT